MSKRPANGVFARLKALRWQIITLTFGLLTLASFVLYQLQGSILAEQALNQGQRVLLPLHEDSQWVGQNILMPEPRIVPILQAEPETSAETGVELAEGQIAASKEPEDETEDESYPQMVVSDRLMQEAQKQQKPAPTAVEPAAEETPPAEPTESEPAAPVETAEPEEQPVETTTSEQEVTTPPQSPKNLDRETTPGQALKAAPNPQLVEKLGEFELPVIAKDGIKPWRYYSKPISAKQQGKPQIAIIIHGLGLGKMTTENALNLDSNVTLSFSPYARNTRLWGSHARNTGHEILLDLPQETQDYPAVDPGPYALLNTLDKESNLQRLHWVMSRVPGYIGFLQPENIAEPTLNVVDSLGEIARRGLVLVKPAKQSSNEAIARLEQFGLIQHPYQRRLDSVLSREAIRRQLDLLVKDAKSEGGAVAVARPYPLTLEILQEWMTELETMGVTLVPVSAIIKEEL